MTRTTPLDRYRNIGILANLDAGRTTTTERILAVAGREEQASRGVLNDLPAWVRQDNERDITLTSAATSCGWGDCRINIVELPAFGLRPASGALNVLDGTIVMVDAVTGVTAEVEAALVAAEARGIARLVFVNKLDRDGAELTAVLARLTRGSTARPVPLQLAIGIGTTFTGLVDLVEERATFWRDSAYDAPAEEGEIPADLRGAVTQARGLIAAAVGLAADAAPAVLAERVRAAVRAGTILPVLYGSAFRNRGIRRLLDAIVAYLPAPTEVALNAVAADGKSVDRRASDDEPFTGLAFQTVEDPSAGRLTFVRIYSGVVATGGQMLNSVSASSESIGRMVRIFANHAEEINEARAGDIVALSGLQHTATGDTLCDPAAPVILERIPAVAGRAKY